MLADLESLEKRVGNLEKRAKGGDKESVATLGLANLALAELNAGRPARAAKVARRRREGLADAAALTAKPALYVATSTRPRPSTATRSPSWSPSAPGATTPRRW